MTYNIKVAEFEGPFDLILFFIERDELDIYDIPIAKITDDFLAYIRDMQSMDIDLASEFILVAATLMRIKAKTLLPRKELDEQGEEIDPRAELVAKLLEYKRYKGVLDDMRNLSEERKMMHVRGDSRFETRDIYDSYETEMDLESLNLYKLLKVFKKVLDRLERRESDAKIEHRVHIYPYTISSERENVLVVLAKPKHVDKEWLDFVDIFEECEEKMHAIFRFLAILEMIQLKILQMKADDDKVNYLFIKKGEKELNDVILVDSYAPDDDENKLGGGDDVGDDGSDDGGEDKDNKGDDDGATSNDDNSDAEGEEE